jgi:peptidoglycan/LPS O-acetylase OafA/YrhL
MLADARREQPMTRPIQASPGRLVEVDALRGFAALSVVFFHYTSRYLVEFKPSTPPSFEFSNGQYGLVLFFIISGFVIFMTLDKTRQPMDFLVSRFSRLYPVYWVSVAVTFVATHAMGLPGHLVGLKTAVANLLMFHGLFGVAHVDSVYWTLEVELLFYCSMLALFCLGWLDRILAVMAALIGLRLVYVLLHQYGVDLPWMVYRLLILENIAWFAIGVSIYLLTSRQGSRWAPLATIAWAVLSLYLAESLFVAAIAAGLAPVVYLAASGRLPLLRQGVFIWLGAISYPLYLVHENIGWGIQLRLAAWGVPTDVTIAVALVCSLALATALHRLVEMPAMRWLRARYRERRAAAVA